MMHKLLLRLSPVLLLAAGVLFAIGQPLLAGCTLIAFFLAASIGVRASEKLRGISYSLMIFAAVTFAMCFPAPLVSWGGFKLSLLIVPLLQIIMFGMGALMKLNHIGISVYRSGLATVEDTVAAFKAGKLDLVDPNQACAHHGHGHT